MVPNNGYLGIAILNILGILQGNPKKELQWRLYVGDDVGSGDSRKRPTRKFRTHNTHSLEQGLG